MFVVVGCVVAFKARVPCVVRARCFTPPEQRRFPACPQPQRVPTRTQLRYSAVFAAQVITTTVRGRSSLCQKVIQKLLLMPDGKAMAAAVCDLPGGSSPAHVASLREALGGSPDPALSNRGALFVADTCAQVYRTTYEIENLRLRAPNRGRFLLLLDEADAMQRTDGDMNEPIKLERAITTLCGGKQDEETGRWYKLGDDPDHPKKSVLLAESFFGPQAVVLISATLLPVFLRGFRDAKKRGKELVMHPFYTNYQMDDYVGVASALWQPFELQPGMARPLVGQADDTADAAGSGDVRVFLPEKALSINNWALYDNWGLALAFYRHACTAVNADQCLLLDVTLARVNADYNVRARRELRAQRFGGGTDLLPRLATDWRES
jgi:hypothetical protein